MHRALLTVVLLAVLAVATPAAATVVIPVAEADLVTQSDAIVIARVTAIESHADRGHIYTNVTLAIDETLKGDSVPTLTVRLLGGRVGDHAAWVEGSPEFRRGERALLFLTAHRDGTPRVAHLYQGKFAIVQSSAGGEMAVRDTPAGVRLPSGARVPLTAARPLRPTRRMATCFPVRSMVRLGDLEQGEAEQGQHDRNDPEADDDLVFMPA